MTTTIRKDRKLLFREMARSDLITIEVDAGLGKYRVYEALLVYHLEYFQRALNGRWTEADDRMVRLEDVDSDTFGLFVGWLYTNELPFTYGTVSMWCTEFNEEEVADMQIPRLKLFALADRLQCSTLTRSLRRLITYQLIKFEPVSSKFIAFVYENLGGEHPFLQLAVDSYCSDVLCDSDAAAIFPFSEDVPKAFLQRVTDRLALTHKDRPPRLLLSCDYHGHSSEEDRKLFQAEEAEEFGKTW